ncbi:hypothetical protein [Bradyrhizobium algeriense]|uniref:hypothetical protein n=1 Tax=Bradyrhizobium algeriense TaxID=634784 RepID=UPI00167CC4D2|nr:hypothetical protein [Bradyrhizobium algeriense]
MCTDPAILEEARDEGVNHPGTVAAIGADVDLAEHHCQQARAQEHEAGRRQGKKSVGDNVVAAHDTPTTQMLVRIYQSFLNLPSHLSEAARSPRTARRSNLKLWNDSLQMRVQGKCPRSPNPSPL